MKSSADLGGCYPPRPSASVENTLLDLQYFSYPTQPHSIIANYTQLSAWSVSLSSNKMYLFLELINDIANVINKLNVLRLASDFRKSFLNRSHRGVLKSF